MKKILAGGLLAVTASAIGAYGILRSGAVSFAADQPHPGLVTQLIGWAREQSIAKAASDIAVPGNLADPKRIRRGAGNYDAMCADCHLVPGGQEPEIRRGLYPAPPDLTDAPARADTARTDARRFWIIKHGIKGSGMAAWSRGGMDDEDIWNLVAFLRRLPQLTGPAYAELVAHSAGHTHGGEAQGAHEHEQGHGHDEPPAAAGDAALPEAGDGHGPVAQDAH